MVESLAGRTTQVAGNISGMGLFIFGGDNGVSEEEIQLGRPDATEAKSLGVHVRKCALRYSIFTRRQAAQGNDIVQIKYMMLGLIGLVLLTSPQARNVFEWASKLF